MKNKLDNFEREQEYLSFLTGAGVKPDLYVLAKQAAAPGFELPGLIREHLHSQAWRNITRRQHARLDPVPPERAIYIGEFVDDTGSANLDVNEMGHIIIAGSTNVGKNNCAKLLIRGLLRLGKRAEVIAQKGDELEMLAHFPDSLYLPFELEPWNDWTPCGPDRFGFWTANAEAFAIPKGLKEQTFPEIPLIAEQMWRSRPHFSLNALIQALRWKAKQPGGREKLETAAGALATHGAAIGDRAYVEQGIDVRNKSPLTICGALNLDLIQLEVALGQRFVRERYDALERGHSRAPERAIFIPEAQLLYSREVEAARRGYVSYLVRFLTMARSLRLLLLLAIQNVSRTSTHVLNNASTFICFRQDGVADARLCAERLGLNEESVPEIMSFPPGMAYFRSTGSERAHKIRMPQIVSDESPSEPSIRQRYQPVYAQFRAQAVYADRRAVIESIAWDSLDSDSTTSSAESPGKTVTKEREAQLLADHIDFLQDIVAHPSDGLKVRYDRIGVGIERGNGLLRDLKGRGLVAVDEVKVAGRKGGRPRLVASLTDLGKEWLASAQSRS